MLSKSAKYATKAVLFLAVNSDEDKKVTAKDIAKQINVPQAYIAKLLQELSKHNLISSSRGPKGGFYLNEKNRNESIMSIIEVIDGENKMTKCLIGLEECNADKPCPLHNIASSARTELINSFRNNSIDDLANEIKRGKAFLTN